MKQDSEKAIDELRARLARKPGRSLGDVLIESRREEKEHEERKDRERSPASHDE